MTNVSVNRVKEVSLLFFIVLLVLLFRRTDAFTNPQLWAEDGTVFLQQYIDNGISSIFMPYAGYLHLIPRLTIATFGLLHINLLYIPLCYNAVTFLIVFLVAVYLWKCAVFLGLNNRVLFACSFLLLPLGAEMFMNITNIIWFTALFLVAFIIVGSNFGNIIANSIMVLVCSLTGPFSLLLSPVVALIILIERKTITRKKLIPLIIILICGAIQFGFIKHSGSITRALPGEAEPLHVVRLVTNNMRDLLFLNSGLLPELSPLKEMALCIILFGFFLYLFGFNYVTMKLERKYVLILAPILFLGSFIVAFWPTESRVTAFGCPRYYFITYACIAWVFIIAYDKKIKLHYLAIYAVYFLLQSKHEMSTLVDKHWKQQVSEYYGGKRQALDINPEGWKVNLPPRVNK